MKKLTRLLPPLMRLTGTKRPMRQALTVSALVAAWGLEALEPRTLLSGVTDDLTQMNDEFDDSTTLANWQRVNEVEHWNADQLQVWDIDQTQEGRMVMQPHTVVWYQNWRGPMAFKEVTGDFIFTTEVLITDRDDVGVADDDDIPNEAEYSLAGLMVRTPREINDPSVDWQMGSMVDDDTNNGENYVFLSLGHGADGQLSLESKTTRNSDSQLELTPIHTNHLELRIARVGDAVISMYRFPGQQWTVHRRFDRDDMPETLQLGLVSYTDWGKASDFDPFTHNSSVLNGTGADPTPFEPYNPDVIAGFDFARFERPVLPAELEGVNLVTEASNLQLLSFLGDPQTGPQKPMKVGVNLEGIVDWSSAWIFKDAFKKSRPWTQVVRNLDTGGTTWGGGTLNPPPLNLDENGWVTSLESWVGEDGYHYQQEATAVVFTGESNPPAGTYRAEWEGDGDILIWYETERGLNPDGSHYAIVEIPEGAIDVFVTISATNPADPIRNIRLWMPDYNGESLVGDTWALGDDESPFHPLFIERLQPFDTIRFMDWMHTNAQTSVDWDDRARLEHSTMAEYEEPAVGIAPEYIVQLANELGSNAWVNMPHMASNDYVQQFAEFMRDNLDPERTIYVEWSNELWNGIFPVSQWITQQQALPENSGMGYFEVAAQEIRRDFEIWEQVFAGQEDRIVRVVAGQQANPYILGTLLENLDGHFDAGSVTAYADISNDLIAGYDEFTTADDIIDDLLTQSIPWSVDRLAENHAVTQQYELLLGREIPLLSYESGAHVFSYGSWFGGSPANPAAIEALNSPRMYEVYQELLNGARAAGLDLYNEFTFTSHASGSPFGTFGILKPQDEPLDTAYEYQAILDFLEEQDNYFNSFSYEEHFENETHLFTPLNETQWSTPNVNGSTVYQVDSSGGGGLGLAVADINQPIPERFEIKVDVLSVGGPNRWHDGFVIFDYVDGNNFKYAGSFVGQNQWVVGHYQGHWGNRIAQVDWDDVGRSIDPNEVYQLHLIIDGNDVEFHVNDELVIDTGFSPETMLNGGGVGLAAQNAVTWFDNFLIKDEFPADPEFMPFEEDFETGPEYALIPTGGPEHTAIVNPTGLNHEYQLDMSGMLGLKTALASFDGELPSAFQIEVDMTATAGANRWQDGFLIFDYVDETNFKYAGSFVGQNQWVIGHYLGHWGNRLAQVDWDDIGETIDPGQTYHLAVDIVGNLVELTVDGVQILSTTFTGESVLHEGGVGIAVQHAETNFDNFSVGSLVDQLFEEDLEELLV